MKNSPEKNIDELLEMMKNLSVPEKDFQSTEKFKTAFFQRVEQGKRTAARRFYKIFLPAAAAFLLCAGIVLMNFPPAADTVTQAPAPVKKSLPPKTAPAPVKKSLPPKTAPAPAKKSALPPPETAVASVDSAAPAETMAPPAADRMTAVMGMPIRAAHNNYYSKAHTSAEYHPGRRLRLNTAEYKSVSERGFTSTASAPFSTFGADVDTAGYTNVRQQIMTGNQLPAPASIRTEEFLNYFHYDYPAPEKAEPFRVTFEAMDAPWAPERKLLLVGVQAKKVDKKQLPPSNFVFLIDNSGSMWDSFPMVIEAMETLAGQLRENDRISIVTYGGGVQVLLDGGSGADKAQIKAKLRALTAGGWTPGGAGIVEAYKLGRKHFIKGGNNRIVLITDGDFNVGASSEAALVAMVEKERQSGIYLSAFGVGMYNFKDNKLKMLANKGNGNYTFLDNAREARQVMTNEMTGKMFTLAKDVKFQIEFNPARVAAYRLVGYEMRALADRDFNDDTKDSGEVGVGHQVTAVYELIMADAPDKVKKAYSDGVDKLKYQQQGAPGNSGDILTFKLRYQQPEGKAPSALRTFELKSLPRTTDNIRWAAAVTEFTLLLRNSKFKGNASFRTLRTRAQKLLGKDEDGKRAEFLTIIKAAGDLQK